MHIKNLYEIEKSKFYCEIISVDSEENAKEIIARISKEHKKATHNCFVYRMNINGREYLKMSDDGEPKGTAAAPMLNVLTKNNIDNVVCVVSRYFGGKKLGAGGLIRAYSKSVSECIKSTQ